MADKAFNDLKSRLCSAPILSLPDFSVPFTIYTDASDFGLAAVLSIIWLSTSGTGASTLVGDVAHLATLIARPPSSPSRISR